ncbi:MAG: Ig-like domain-containing protein, partial [Candidatus Staskawiczbacteria bacterium]
LQTQPPAAPQPPVAKKIFPKKSLLRNILLGVFFVLIIAVGLYFLSSRYVSQISQTTYYSENYRLVPEELSQSSAIRISLPKGADKAAAEKGATFDPEIKGNWVESKPTAWWQAQKALAAVVEQKINTNFIIFQPQDPLDLNKHYSVTVDLGEGKILSSDFLVQENPKVTAIFPAADSEAPDNSKITIVFNRPMVPLTTIDELESQNIPVQITPATDGKFKWISTNTLQFIPSGHLVDSSNYDVKIKDGFISMDGLAVAGFESKFQVLKIRYADNQTYTQIQSQIYDQPVRIYFNQPVSVSQTKAEISVIDKSTGQQVPVEIQYAMKTQDEIANNPQYKTGDSFGNGENYGGPHGFNFIGKMTAGILDFLTGQRSDVDQNTIEIYQQKDEFGRQRFWDFNKSYTVTINKAYPTEGDIVLITPKVIDFTTADVVSGWTAHSDRTNLAGLGLFDPQGYLTATFFENIDLSRSNITATNLQKIEYGQKCKDPNDPDTVNCEKTQDNKTLNLYFNANAIKPGDSISINLNKIVNTGGLQINRNTISVVAQVFAPLKVYLGDSSKSYDNLSKKYLNGFYLCSNNPILAPDKSDFQKDITGTPDFQINSFSQSYRPYDNQNSPCPMGT